MYRQNFLQHCTLCSMGLREGRSSSSKIFVQFGIETTIKFIQKGMGNEDKFNKNGGDAL